METQQRSEAPGYLYFLFSFLSSYLFRTSSLPQFFPFLLLPSIPPLLLFPLLFSFFFSSPFSPCSLTIYLSLLLQTPPTLSPIQPLSPASLRFNLQA